MPDSTINHTAAGWPYLDKANFWDVVPHYTEVLAQKLQNGEADVAAAINVAAEAKAARDQAQAIAGQLDEVAALNIAAGWTSATIPSGFTGGQHVDITVVFPSDRFTAAPTVVASPRLGTSWAFSVIVTAVSATSCTLRIVSDRDYTAGNQFTAIINWIAVAV